MSRVAWTQFALEDLQRLRTFLRPKSAAAARHAADAIIDAVQGACSASVYGAGGTGPAGVSGTINRFGSIGYVALYRVDCEQVTVVALRAGRERCYRL